MQLLDNASRLVLWETGLSHHLVVLIQGSLSQVLLDLFDLELVLVEILFAQLPLLAFKRLVDLEVIQRVEEFLQQSGSAPDYCVLSGVQGIQILL